MPGISPSRLGELLRAVQAVALTYDVLIATVGHAGDL
jgi:hypothetical protein